MVVANGFEGGDSAVHHKPLLKILAPEIIGHPLAAGLPGIIREGKGVDDLEQETAARLQHSGRFGNGCGRIGQFDDEEVGNGRLESPITKRQL